MLRNQPKRNLFLHHAAARGDGVADERAPQVHVLSAPAQDHVLAICTVVTDDDTQRITGEEEEGSSVQQERCMSIVSSRN
jgi:hypothetical protein